MEPNPFKGRVVAAAPPMRVLHRFAKSGRSAEVRQREVRFFAAIEFIVFVDGKLLESQMFHGKRVSAYASELAKRVDQFTETGWAVVEEDASEKSQ